MWVLLGSEYPVFGALISTYLLYKGSSFEAALPEHLCDIPLTSAGLPWHPTQSRGDRRRRRLRGVADSEPGRA